MIPLKHTHQRIYIFVMIVIGLSSCSISRFVPQEKYLLDKVSISVDDASLSKEQFIGYIQQHPNTRWFGLWKVPMFPYSISGTDTTKRINRFLQKVGQSPIIYDKLKAENTRKNIESAVRNMGYLRSDVSIEEKTHRHKIRITYAIHPKERFYVSQLERCVENYSIRSILDKSESLIKKGMPFDINQLDQERTRISTLLRNQGYYRFTKEDVRFRADTTSGPNHVRLITLVDPKDVQPYHIGKVQYRTDSIFGRRSIRENVLKNKTHLFTGALYKELNLQKTYGGLGSLGAIMSSNVAFTPNLVDTTSLDAHISVYTAKPHSFNAELEGTNSAGDLGAAVSLSYQNRNLMRGSELLNLKVRGAYEAIRNLSGYKDQDYIEYGAEASLSFPDLKIPGLKSSFRRSIAGVSEVSLLYNSQNRPEFHRRVVTGVWRYRWHTADHFRQHRVDLMDLNYVFMPWISSTFKHDYLENDSSRNAILRYNYENLFIMKLGYQVTISNHPLTTVGNYGTNAWTLRLGSEIAGNLMYGFSNLLNAKRNTDGHYSVFNIAYAQYAKADLDFSKSFRFTPTQSLALHLGVGIAYPYGNSRILPYEKRYFSGGANSVRGWSVRGLGPGSFQGRDGRIDFINQTGDIKIDMNLEYRTHLFWKVDGAAFVDAGNIWTIRNYTEQPGGQFRFDSFWKQIALSYGLGVRFNFNYFILRFDVGMKAINPAYKDIRNHYPIYHPNLSRDAALHFAVGLPF